MTSPLMVNDEGIFSMKFSGRILGDRNFHSRPKQNTERPEVNRQSTQQARDGDMGHDREDHRRDPIAKQAPSPKRTFSGISHVQELRGEDPQSQVIQDSKRTADHGSQGQVRKMQEKCDDRQGAGSGQGKKNDKPSRNSRRDPWIGSFIFHGWGAWGSWH